ncbi:TetR/AcrR family transcriptional regulator [Raineyella sp. W15-4]|uniref:TetR/AcrR family transcriptional regulator n=1 Tax=Raineyella sp. W15-4 TaxID=3081651 RepID=UPI002954C0AC|nr:TetR/AcrR family transcriptional regulator [Raineyella sp. W15-4]WOQ15772.1 TetR/AcrR family transcriptional regulator [Raineyella sp. W15-4]
MGRTTGRSADDTRRAVLTAAAVAIRTKGVHVSLDDIARQAGVSKGGLLYHFPSKEELILELVRDLLASFRASIEAHLDPQDTMPGGLARAYLRTLFAPAEEEARDAIAVMIQLMVIPEVAELARADARDLQAELGADGLSPEVLALVVSSADGVSAAPLWGAAVAGEEYPRLGRHLIELTRRPELWEDLHWDERPAHP